MSSNGEICDILRIDPLNDCRCCGLRKDGQPCGNIVAIASRESAYRNLSRCVNLSSSSRRLHDNLKTTAALLLCKRYHQNQCSAIAAKWLGYWDAYQDSGDSGYESESLSEEEEETLRRRSHRSRPSSSARSSNRRDPQGTQTNCDNVVRAILNSNRLSDEDVTYFLRNFRPANRHGGTRESDVAENSGGESRSRDRNRNRNRNRNRDGSRNRSRDRERNEDRSRNRSRDTERNGDRSRNRSRDRDRETNRNRNRRSDTNTASNSRTSQTRTTSTTPQSTLTPAPASSNHSRDRSSRSRPNNSHDRSAPFSAPTPSSTFPSTESNRAASQTTIPAPSEPQPSSPSTPPAPAQPTRASHLECGICYEPYENPTDGFWECQSCHNRAHADCHRTWCSSSGAPDRDVRCVYCRAVVPPSPSSS